VKLEGTLERRKIPLVRFSEHHIRIDGQLDIFLRTRRSGFSYHDLVTGERGLRYEDPEDFALAYLARSSRTSATKEEFVEGLVNVGWNRGDAEAEYIKAVREAKS